MHDHKAPVALIPSQPQKQEMASKQRKEVAGSGKVKPGQWGRVVSNGVDLDEMRGGKLAKAGGDEVTEVA